MMEKVFTVNIYKAEKTAESIGSFFVSSTFIRIVIL